MKTNISATIDPYELYDNRNLDSLKKDLSLPIVPEPAPTGVVMVGMAIGLVIFLQQVSKPLIR